MGERLAEGDQSALVDAVAADSGITVVPFLYELERVRQKHDIGEAARLRRAQKFECFTRAASRDREVAHVAAASEIEVGVGEHGYLDDTVDHLVSAFDPELALARTIDGNADRGRDRDFTLAQHAIGA